MPNKITGYQPTEPLAPVKGRAGNSPVVDKGQSTPSGTQAKLEPAADQVTLTGGARTLQKLSAAVASAPVVDAAKVAAAKQAVQTGNYEVNVGRLADKILQFEKGLK